MSGALPLRAPLFPIAGAILFPRAQLPLHIFEPRYRDMVRDCIDDGGSIAIVQPRLVESSDEASQPIYDVGCIGEIVGVEELHDGRFNIVLNGTNRFRLTAEVDLGTAYLVPGGTMLVEIGHEQADAVVDLVASYPALLLAAISNDLQNIPRVAIIERKIVS